MQYLENLKEKRKREGGGLNLVPSYLTFYDLNSSKYEKMKIIVGNTTIFLINFRASYMDTLSNKLAYTFI